MEKCRGEKNVGSFPFLISKSGMFVARATSKLPLWKSGDPSALPLWPKDGHRRHTGKSPGEKPVLNRMLGPSATRAFE